MTTMNFNKFTFRKIDLPVEPSTIEAIRKQYPWPANPDTGVEYSYFSHYKFDPVQGLNPRFIDLMEWGGMKIKHCEVFYRPGTGEDFDAFIHVDGHKVVDCVAKINWVQGGTGNVMHWWMPRVAVEERHQLVTNAGTKYLTFPRDEVMEIDATDMHGLYVVNAGIPHSVDMNVGSPDEPRICLSIVPTYIVTPAGKKPNDNMGGDEVYLRLLFGAAVMDLVPKQRYIDETLRVTGEAPSQYALEVLEDKFQERIQYDIDQVKAKLLRPLQNLGSSQSGT